MGNIFFTVMIYPLTQVIEFAFMLFYKIFKNEGAAVIGVSITVSTICLPIYIVAEHWQRVQRDIEQRLEPGVRRIKDMFKGDEQYMLLSTYYRQNHYHPIMQLRSAFGLMIQIPFFIAAYDFLSNLSILKGGSFLFIRDMGLPDALFHIGSFPINILPIAMTLINIAAGIIYTKGFKLKDKLQIYVMAAIFLVILYNSPAGLVLYWTMNNIFSLIKNIFYRFKNPTRALYILFAATIVGLDYYLIFVKYGFQYKRWLLISIFTASLFVPFAVKGFKRLLDTALKSLVENKRQRFVLFFCSSLALCLLAGFVIPSYVINSSVIEFADIDIYGNPLFFLYNSMLQVFGLFVFWPICIYFLYNERIQTGISVFMLVILFVGIVDAFIFSGDYGFLSRLITFSTAVPVPNVKLQLGNYASLVVVIVIPFLLIRFKRLNSLNVAVSIILFAEFAICIAHAMQINIAYRKYKDVIAGQLVQETSIKPVYHLSKNGRNVVVFMFDRAESAYFEPIFETFPELHDIYDGFVFYKNTVSFGRRTMLASAALFGGYEYTPAEINRNDSKLFIEKQNEALLVMPRIFSETAGFEATATDSSYANLSYISDMSIYDSYPKISGFNVMHRYVDLWIKENPDKIKPNITSTAIKRNLAWFSLFKMSPMIIRHSVYDDGVWWSSDGDTDDIITFLDSYSSLEFMTRLTDFSAQKDTFFSIVNETTHSSQKLQAPDYRPTIKVTDTGPEPIGSFNGIGGNIAMFKLIGEWLEYLKANNCYDNTRIIMVSDHGIGSGDGLKLDFPAGWSMDFNPDGLHPLLFVKDFNAHGDFIVNYDFMTNADVPAIALAGIVEHPINPFTGKEICTISPKEKKASGVIFKSAGLSIDGRTFKISNSDWGTVEKNIFDATNWQEGVIK